MALLVSASKSGDVDRVKFYLARGLDVNQADQHGNTALVWACRCATACVPQSPSYFSATATITALVEAGADLDR